MRQLLQRLRPSRKHFFRLLSALALALVVWLYVTNSRNPETKVPFDGVALQIQGLPTDYVLTDSQGMPLAALPTVALVAWAPQAEHLTRDSFTVYAEMSTIQGPGSYDLPVQVVAPGGVRTWEVTPRQVQLRVEQYRRETYSVTVELLGEPGLPYIVGSPRINPIQVSVEGPLSRLQLVRRVLARVDLAGRTAPLLNAPLTLVAVDSAGNEVKGVTTVPSRATVTVPIALQGGNKAISVVPVTQGQPAAGYYVLALEVVPDTVTIFSGDPAVLAELSYLETAPVAVTGRSRDFTETVDIVLPSNVSLIRSPTQVTVTVRFGRISPQLRLSIPVRIEGTAEGLQAAWQPQWLSILVRGPLEVLQGLDLGSFWAVVDVTGLEAGEYDLVATYQAPAGVEVAPSGPPNVHVVLSPVATPTPTPAPTDTPLPLTPTPTPTPLPTVSPTPLPSPTPSTTPSPEPSPTPSPPPSPTP